MSEFLKSTLALDKQINEATSFEDIRALSKANLKERGIITQNVHEDGNYGARIVRVPEQKRPAVSPAKPLEIGSEFQRAIRIGDRITLLTAGSVSGLDILERALRQGRL